MTILTDSSVWIDFFNGKPSPQTDRLNRALLLNEIVLGDLVVAEVLQGVRTDKKFEAIRRRFAQARNVDVGGHDIAVQAATNYRILHARGISIRKTIDTLIATRCIVEGWPLLYSDRDFDPFVEHLGLKRALD